MKSSKTRNFIVGGVAALVILAGGGAYAVASSNDSSGEKEPMLTKTQADRAEAAATAEVNGQPVEVEATEDHGGGYEVEVLRDDGSSVDVYLTKSFAVAGVEADHAEGKEGKEGKDGEDCEDEEHGRPEGRERGPGPEMEPAEVR